MNKSEWFIKDPTVRKVRNRGWIPVWYHSDFGNSAGVGVQRRQEMVVLLLSQFRQKKIAEECQTYTHKKGEAK